jgi:hypothetical protein
VVRAALEGAGLDAAVLRHPAKLMGHAHVGIAFNQTTMTARSSISMPVHSAVRASCRSDSAPHTAPAGSIVGSKS